MFDPWLHEMRGGNSKKKRVYIYQNHVVQFTVIRDFSQQWIVVHAFHSN